MIRLWENLTRKGLSLFTPAEFRRALSLSTPAAYMALQRYAKQGAVLRLRNGLYMLSWQKPSPLAIANRLYRPSYLSYETALAYYHLIPETVYAYTSATPRRPREFEVEGQAFVYHSIKPKAYGGYRTEKIGEDTLLIAEPEKALCDYLHHVFLGRRELNDRLDWKKADMRKLLAYAELFGPGGFLGWVRHAFP